MTASGPAPRRPGREAATETEAAAGVGAAAAGEAGEAEEELPGAAAGIRQAGAADPAAR